VAVTTPPVPDLQYGSDLSGLICAYRFSPDQPGVPITGDQAAESVSSASADASFVWLHFSLSNAASERWLRQHLQLPPTFYETLQDSSSTRVEESDDHLLAVLNDVVYFAIDASNASPVHACVGPRAFVTARVTALRSLDRLRARVKAGRTFRSSCAVLAHLLGDQADVLADIVRDATRQVDAIEDKLLAGQAASGRAKLGALRRVLVRLQRLLAPEPAALFRLLNRPPAWVTEEDVRDLRQAAEELAAAVTDSAALGERVRLIQEEIAALVSEQTSRTLFVLTIVTVLALPMTIIPGLFGMNVGGVPFRDSGNGFWLALLVAGVTAGAGWFLVRVIRR
jgi:zinc transporter